MLSIREGMSLLAAACNEWQGSEYDRVWSIYLLFLLEGTDTFLGGQINRGTVEGHTWMLLLFLLRYSINCHGNPILCVEWEVSEGDIIHCFRAIPVCQEVQHSFLE